MKEKVIESIEKNKLIVIMRDIPTERLLKTAEALMKGGIHLIEVTFNAKNRETNFKTAECINILSREYGDELLVGAGTVLSTTQLEMAYQAGAKYCISPNVDSNVIAKAVDLKMVSIPGALTPTEIQAENLYGADFVKLFPVTSLGVGYIKAVKAPLSHIKFLAVGGITVNNLKSYLDIGVSGVGVGGNLVNKELIMNGKFDDITTLAKQYTKQIL